MVTKQKFHKWNSFVDITIHDVIKLFEARGLDIKLDEAVITGTIYNPEEQVVRIFVSSLVTPKRDKELAKIWLSEESIK
jgi:hypothetical protein